MDSKIVTMREAVSRFIHDGDAIAMGTALEAAIPFSLGHEIIRQKKKDLTLVGPISDMLFDQLVGSGCVGKLVAAWMGNVIMGVGYNIRRAIEKKTPRAVEVDDHTNFSLSLALHAGALGVPFVPTKTLLGTDILCGGSPFKEIACPLTKENLVIVPACNPDVTIVQAQRADEEGNTHFWGASGVTKEAALAAKRIIVVVEEIVSKKVIRTDPNRTIIPGFLVSGIVPEPWGAHPSAVQGYYNRDHAVYISYHEQSKRVEGYVKWLKEWVLCVRDRYDYMSRLGDERKNSLSVKKHKRVAGVDYGF